jgi:hypothetical protein
MGAALLAAAIALLLPNTGSHAQGTDALPYSKGFLVTGNYVVGGIDLHPQINAPVNGFATGEIHIGNVAPNPETGEPGNIVPAGADIVAAFLYWEAVHPTLGEDVPSPVEGVKFRNSPISPTAIKGTSLPLSGNLATCWGAAGGAGASVTMFRADVLHLLPKQYDAQNKWTGKYIVNDGDFATSKDLNGSPYGPHTVTLPELAGDQAIQSAGATLFLVYRTLDVNEPLRKILVFDGVHHKPQGQIMAQTLRGFYKSAGGAARLSHLVATGGNNQTEVISFNGAPITPPFANPFPQTSPSSDRSWANPTRVVTMPSELIVTEYGEEVTTTVQNTNNNPNDCQAWAAVFFSTEVADVDDDGLPDGVEDSATALKDPPTASSPAGHLLPDLNAMLAGSDKRDLFVEVNAMWAPQNTAYGSATAPFSATDTQVIDEVGHSHMPTPEVLKMVGDAYKLSPVDSNAGIRVHFDVGNPATYRTNYLQKVCPDPEAVCAFDATVADEYLVSTGYRGGEVIKETACSDALGEDSAESVNCQFPSYPGTVGWKIGFQLYRDAPVGNDGEELTVDAIQQTWGSGDHRRRFDVDRRDFFHYLLYAHARGKPRSDFPCLLPVPDSGDPPVLKPADFDANNGTSCGTKANPDFHAPRSVSGIADLPGNNVMVTLGLWDTEDFVASPYVQAATTLHEIGHNLNLWHGGIAAKLGNKAATPPSSTYLEPNCKPNYLSSMSYLFQAHGLFDADGELRLDYSRTAHTDANPKNISESNLPSGALAEGVYRPAWFAPAISPLAGSLGASPATRFCGAARFDPWSARKAISVGDLARPSVFTGFIYQATAAGITGTTQPIWPTVLNGTVTDGTVTWKAATVAMARVYAGSPGAVIDWDGGLPVTTSAQDVNFDGTLSPLNVTDLLYGFNDWTNVRLDQIGAGRSAAKYSNGDFADFGSGDFVDYGSGDFMDYGSGDFVDFGSGDFADFGSGVTFSSGDFVDFGSGDFMDFGSGDFMDFGSGDFADFGSGDFMDFGSGDFVDFGSGDFADFGSGSSSPELEVNAAIDLGRAAPHGLKVCRIGIDCVGPLPSQVDPQVSHHRMLLRWKKPTFGRVLRYRIERMRTDVVNQPWVEIVPNPSVPTLTATSYVDEELPYTTTFRYRLRADFDDHVPGVGPYSNESAEMAAVNDAPQAQPDPSSQPLSAYTTIRNAPFALAAPGVLANDDDADSATATGPNTFVFRARRAVLTGPGAVVAAPNGLRTTTTAGGVIVLRFDGSFTYTPKNGFTGTDTFQYKSSSGLWIRDLTVPLSDFSTPVTVTFSVVSKK